MEGDNLPGAKVVPPHFPICCCSRDANQRGELQVLMGELDEFDATATLMQLVTEHVRLGREDGSIAFSKPYPFEQSKPRRLELLSGRCQVQMGVQIRVPVLTLRLPVALT